MRTALATACLLILVLPGRCGYADGIPFTGNRVDGETTVISFTQDQLSKGDKEVDGETWQATFVVLSPAQKERLLEESGVSVDRIELLSVDEAKGDCACFMEDIGIEFEEGRIEIPHRYLAPYRRADDMPALDRRGEAIPVSVKRQRPYWIYVGAGVVLAACIAALVVLKHR